VFGKPLAEHQWIHYHLAELCAELDVLRHYNYAAAEAYVKMWFDASKKTS